MPPAADDWRWVAPGTEDPLELVAWLAEHGPAFKRCLYRADDTTVWVTLACLSCVAWVTVDTYAVDPSVEIPH